MSLSSNACAYTTTPTGIRLLTLTPEPSTPTLTLLALPGFASSPTDFLPLLSHLSTLHPQTRYISLAYPGHGNSPHQTPPSTCPEPSIEAFADIVNQVREELALDAGTSGVVLVGHSMGTRVALEAFRRRPEGVKALVLLDGSYHVLTPDAAIMERGPTLGTPEGLKATAKFSAASPSNDDSAGQGGQDQRDKAMKDALKTAMTTIFGPSTPVTFQEDVLKHVDGLDVGYMTKLRKAMVEYDTSPEKKLEKAVDAVVGSRVNVLNVQGTEGFSGRRVGLRKGDVSSYMRFWRERTGDGEGRYNDVVVEGSGHWVMVDKVQEVANEMVDFLGLE